MNEWIMYETATEKYDIMNIASHSLNENEYEYYKKGENEICAHNENMGNYNDEIYGSINIKRALKDSQDVYDMSLQIDYGLFEDPLEIMNIMYLIVNDMLALNINNAIKNENTCYMDDIQNHLMHTCYQHVDNIDEEQGSICNPDKCIFSNNCHAITNDLYMYYKQTNSLVISIPNHTEALHTHINPLILNTTYLPTYHSSLQHIYQHIHAYNTNKIWHNTYLYGDPYQIIEFKGALYQQLDYTHPGILIAKFDKNHKLITRIDNGADVSIMPYKVYQRSNF